MLTPELNEVSFNPVRNNESLVGEKDLTNKLVYFVYPTLRVNFAWSEFVRFLMHKKFLKVTLKIEIKND